MWGGGNVDMGLRVDGALDGRMMNSNPHLGVPRALCGVTSVSLPATFRITRGMALRQ